MDNDCEKAMQDIVETFQAMRDHIEKYVIPAINQLYENLKEAGVDFDALVEADGE